jgi:hypothetical protein
MDFGELCIYRIAFLKPPEIILFFPSIVHTHFKNHIFVEGSLFDNLFLLNYSKLT